MAFADFKFFTAATIFSSGQTAPLIPEIIGSGFFFEFFGKDNPA